MIAFQKDFEEVISRARKEADSVGFLDLLDEIRDVVGRDDTDNQRSYRLPYSSDPAPTGDRWSR